MPTFTTHDRFDRDVEKLTREQSQQWRDALKLFIVAVAHQEFPPQLRVKRVKGTAGVWEMTWAKNGRATFEYGEEIRPGEPHVLWRRIGTHDIFDRP
jgi:mRNA-degrading endonuclease YafQ of YafQ-DinJ toxin-antitoxin module